MAEFQESGDGNSQGRKALWTQIRNNLNPHSIGDILFSGPDRWKHVARQARSHLSLEFADKDTKVIFDDQKEQIEKAKLEPLVWEHRAGDAEGVSIGCKLPTTAYHLAIPNFMQVSPPYDIDRSLSHGKWLELPASTIQGVRFNNGFSGIDLQGNLLPFGSAIKPFKGAIGIRYTHGVQEGSLTLFSPTDTKKIQDEPDYAKHTLPHGGLLLGTPLFAEVSFGHEPNLLDTLAVLEQAQYFATHNREIPALIQVGNDMYYVNNFVTAHDTPHVRQLICDNLEVTSPGEHSGEELFKRKYQENSKLILGTLFAMQAAASLVKPGQEAHIGLTEQNNTGRIATKQVSSVRHYLTRPVLATKL